MTLFVGRSLASLLLLSGIGAGFLACSSSEGTPTPNPTADGGTRHTVTGKFDVKVPLVGGKIASWAEGPAQKRLDAEFAFHQTRLGA